MENTGYIALSRQTALWRQMDMVANNIANMNTTGYRGQDAMFTDYLARVPSSDSAFREHVNFVRDYGTVQDTTQGPLRQTANPMDVALADDGFFVVETPAGQQYTRAGNFSLDNDGKLVTKDGHAVLTEDDAPIFIAPNESQFEVTRDGTVRTENGEVGKLKVVSFEDEQRLLRSGSALFAAGPGQEPQPVENPNIQQGMLEGSNVNGVVEMTKLIDVQRSYERSNKLIENEDERIKKAMQTWVRQA